ncbi:MAG: UDP-N-acetylmuramate dehydrogenase [Alphaproteobacteria bacterium]|nr:UDP-N-acetylmuramate dehydrogenase [Alphaproteobacteria bacterium]
MSFPNITGGLMQRMPQLRGRMSANQALAPFTWFRVGGPAQVFFSPADEEDLAYFLKNLPQDIPVMVMGVGSNLIVRDGGVPGVVIRLGGRAFGSIEILENNRVRAGAAVPDQKFARELANAGLAGMEFFAGIPGTIGGALRMNAGAHGGETTDVLIEARAVTRQGEIIVLSHADMGFSYRHSAPPDDMIFTSALFQGKADTKENILARMDEITKKREASQPIREKTGGSTFANPKPLSAWKVIDEAGCRGLVMGGAQVSEMHCNFLINRNEASAADIENLGEEVRRRVRENSGVELRWEIKRVGISG